MSTKNWLTVDAVSTRYGLAPSYVRKLAQGGVLPYYRPFGKRLYFLAEELDEVFIRTRVPAIKELI